MTSSIRLTRRSGVPVGVRVTTPRSLRLLSVKDSAVYAKVFTQTIRRAIKSGHLQIYRAGRQIRIDEADLLAYLRRQG
jgi:excisionase family DNA binding protein